MPHTALPTTLTAARPVPFWLDESPTPDALSKLSHDASADLLVIGGGYTGLWTALLAKEADPAARVVLIEGETIGHAASGRNGGFCSPSLTHGLSNGLTRWPREIDTLVRLGQENLRAIETTLERYGVDADFKVAGKAGFARTPWQAKQLQAGAEASTLHGDPVRMIPTAELGEWTSSPEFIAGAYWPHYALVDPYKLAIGLSNICQGLGVELYEHTTATLVGEAAGSRVRVHTAGGVIDAERVVLATNAAKPLLRRLALTVIPVYDYALVTEPLTDEQFDSIGWGGDYGITDTGNQFHYSRKTADGRILWGGYDAIYRYGSARDEAGTQRPETFGTLARNFAQTFPQLADVAFSHAWGGIVDSSTRFCVTTGTAARGRIAYALGYTGLGVSATRFAAQAMLDLLDGVDNPTTRLQMIKRRSIPFPPEPVRSVGVQLTKRSMAREDQTGRRNTWLRVMDAVGFGFDS
ncbi:NAD(P)/FAD-dependent oxidoreductase [Rathayibacter soli]|uniref:NAD(P)/FAD-dependent oxidoreductase n=1 Tax=Rathayibacter soli TaxID=3144168 RepID=UPI0027E4D41F|nr:FAD-dependent oxidoreductase [Glaciibacter superstes]